MNQIDKDIDDIQRIIEGRCPSCHQIPELPGVLTQYNGHPETCIRSFGANSAVHYVSEFNADTNSCDIEFEDHDDLITHSCCKEDYEYFTSTHDAWLGWSRHDWNR